MNEYNCDGLTVEAESRYHAAKYYRCALSRFPEEVECVRYSCADPDNAPDDSGAVMGLCEATLFPIFDDDEQGRDYLMDAEGCYVLTASKLKEIQSHELQPEQMEEPDDTLNKPDFDADGPTDEQLKERGIISEEDGA